MMNIYMCSALVVALFIFLINFILKRNWVNKLFNLIFIYIISALLIISLNLDFLGLILIIVYVGAILIFFLFVVMLLTTTNKDEKEESKSVFILTCLFFIFIKYYLYIKSDLTSIPLLNVYNIDENQIIAMGSYLNSKHIFILITAGMILAGTVLVLIILY